MHRIEGEGDRKANYTDTSIDDGRIRSSIDTLIVVCHNKISIRGAFGGKCFGGKTFWIQRYENLLNENP